MSVIVKGMEMPKKCGQCKLYHTEYPMYCLAVEGHRTVGAPYGMPRPDWCPLIELPPHGRLIDADVLKQSAHLGGQLKTYIDTWIDSHATVIEAEGSETE